MSRPASSAVTVTGPISSVTRTGGAGVGDQRPAVPVPDPHRPPARPASKPGASQPCGSRGRSCRSPISRSACRIAANVACHASSVTTCCGGPVGQADDRAGRAVPALGRSARPARLASKPDEARVPAVAEERAEHVLARAEQRGHVVGLVRDALRVVGPARGEHRVADPLPVEPRLVQAERGDVQPGRGDRPAHGERPAQVRGGTQGVAHRVSRAGPGRGREAPPGPGPARSRTPASRRPGPARLRTTLACSTPMPRGARPRPGPATRTGRRGPAGGPA